MADSFVGTIGNVAMKPIRQALLVWSRASELSADRVACIFAPALTLSRALARLEMIPKSIVETMDFDAWSQQGKDYEALRDGTAWNKIVHWLSDSDADHPYTPVRVYEAMKWEQSDVCGWLRSNSFKLESGEEVAEPEQTGGSGSSGWSLPNIPKNIELNSIIPRFKGFKK